MLSEDNADGKVTDEWYMELSHKYEVERMELKAKIAAIQERQRTLSSQKHSTAQFISTVRTFMEMDTLTAPLVKALIDHIDIHETEGTGLNKKQKVDIYYRFVGYIELPEKENNCNHREDMRKWVAVEYITQSA